MSTERKPKIWTVSVNEELPAPGYSTQGGSGSDKDSRFIVEYEFRPSLANLDSAVVLRKLEWNNGSGSPVLTMTGNAGPKMLIDLAEQLNLIARRMENQLDITRDL
jgi:hypothetical protein